MKANLKNGLLILLVFLLFAYTLSEAVGLPSGGSFPPTFTFIDGYWYDSWGFNRNYYGGYDGFMPNVAYETLGINKELAYGIGETFKNTYRSKVQRAEEILNFVQRWTDYGYDIDNVEIGGKPQPEWAWNADEMVRMFNSTTNIVAIGDCEDMSFLCATIYIGAGFDVSLVLTPQHVALLIWLPEYQNANYYWDIPGDGREAGWIWVESTGEQNPLGWTPPDFNDGDWIVYPLGLMITNIKYTPKYPQADDDVAVTASISTTASVNQVFLIYSVEGVAQTELTMTLKGSLYETIIPKQSKGTEVEFYISVTDGVGDIKESEKVSYTVGVGLEIPGFPWESIILGLVLGITVYSLIKRKSFLLDSINA